jgi:hypothetical protein
MRHRLAANRRGSVIEDDGEGVVDVLGGVRAQGRERLDLGYGGQPHANRRSTSHAPGLDGKSELGSEQEESRDGREDLIVARAQHLDQPSQSMNLRGGAVTGGMQPVDDRVQERTGELLALDSFDERGKHSEFLLPLLNAMAHVMHGMAKSKRKQPLNG